MLILTRKVDQGVRLYDAIGRYIGHVMVLGVERDRVKLGFEADSRFVFLRDEVLNNGNNVEGTRPAALDVSNIGESPARAG